MIKDLITQNADLTVEVGLHFLWQATAIALVAWTICRFLLKSPRLRSAVYSFALLAMIVAVPLTLSMVLKHQPVSPAMSDGTAPLTGGFEPAGQIAPEALTSAKQAEEGGSYSLWVFAAYILGLAMMLVRVMMGYRWSSRIRREGQQVRESNWPEALTTAVKSMKAKTVPLMVWSENVVSPVVTGFFRPVIVLPVSFMSGLPMSQAVAILSHELAHLRRYDHLAVFLQRLVEAIFFFHPVVWFVSRRLDQEREKACDDLVMKAGGDPGEYARTLVLCASEQNATLALAAASGSKLEERVLRILGQPEKTSVRMNCGGWMTIAITMVAIGMVSLTPANSEEKEKEPVKNEAINHQVKKLDMVIPSLDFQGATLQEAVEFLRFRSISLDKNPDKTKRGVNFVVRTGGGGDNIINAEIDRLVARNITMREALNAICRKTGSQYRIDEFAVTIMPIQAAPAGGQIVSRTWVTPMDFLAQLTPKAAKQKIEVKELLKVLGVGFPEKSSVSYLQASNSLIIRNTPENLDKIDAIVRGMTDPEEVKKEEAAKLEAQKKALAELGAIVIPVIEFREATVTEAVDFLRMRALQSDPKKKGVNLNIFGGDTGLKDRKIASLSLKNVPLTVAIQYVCDVAKARYLVEGRNISIMPLE